MGLSEKRISITGENGFVGRHLVNALKELNSEVILLKDLNGKSPDIRNQDFIRSSIEELGDIDMIYHLAAKTSVNSSYENPIATYETNILGTLNILEICRRCDIDKIIYASSYVYGQPQYLPIDEKHCTDPSNPYARSKLMGEELCKSYHDDFGIKCVILRPFNIYGPGQRSDFLIPKIISSLSSGNVVLRDSEPRRDFVYIADMIDAYIKAGEYRGDFDIFNIGCGQSYSVKEIINIIIRIYELKYGSMFGSGHGPEHESERGSRRESGQGSKIRVVYKEERRRNEILDCYANIEKAKSILGWRPFTAIDEGLGLMLDNL